MTGELHAPAPKIALVSVGIGRVRRGFERYFSDLFRLLGDAVPMTLFKSAGECNDRERVPPLLRPATALVRRLPLGPWAGSREYNRDCLAFALTMLPRLLREDFDVVHCIDPPLAVALRLLKRWTRLRARLLFTEGCVMPPAYYPAVDHLHLVAATAHRSALAWGIPASSMTMVPCGLHADRFPASNDTALLRQHYWIAADTLVILAISALKREHKRVDYIIDEVRRLEGDVLLWLDGSPEDDSVVRLARERLGPRVRITHVQSSEVPALYRVADVMVHAALEESFGLSIVEAACSGTPVVAHDTPHFAWLLGDREGLIDMRVAGNLSASLATASGGRGRESASARARAASIRERFDWPTLVPAYLAMYRHVAALGSTHTLLGNDNAQSRRT